MAEGEDGQKPSEGARRKERIGEVIKATAVVYVCLRLGVAGIRFLGEPGTTEHSARELGGPVLCRALRSRPRCNP